MPGRALEAATRLRLPGTRRNVRMQSLGRAIALGIFTEYGTANLAGEYDASSVASAKGFSEVCDREKVRREGREEQGRRGEHSYSGWGRRGWRRRCRYVGKEDNTER